MPITSTPSSTRRKKVYLSPGGAFRSDVRMLWMNNPDYVGTNKVNEADVVCWLGGPDLDPQLYGQSPLDGVHISPSMDKADLETWALVSDKDVLKVGICRGGQLLNVLCGGSMWQHVNNHSIRHSIYDIHLRIPVSVTSLHHQMMIPADKGATVVAFTCMATEKRNLGTSWKLTLPGKDVVLPSDLLSSRSKLSVKEKFFRTDYEVLWYKDQRCFCYQPHPEIDQPEGVAYFWNTLDRLAS